MLKACKEYPWTAVVGFLIGALIGFVTTSVTPSFWLSLISGMLLGQWFHYMINGE